MMTEMTTKEQSFVLKSTVQEHHVFKTEYGY